MPSLDGKVAVVTGAGRGIGREHALALAAAGAKVVVYDVGASLAGEGSDSTPAQSVVNEIVEAGGEAVASYDDVSDFGAAEHMVQRAIDRYGTLDILVNNAGILRDRMLVNMSEHEWDAVIAVHLKGHFAPTRAASVVFRQQRSGRIINISSVAAEHVNAGQTNYAASKGAVNAFTRALAVELGSRNVTVNAIAPGFVETDMTEAVRNKAGDFIQKKLIPVRRLGKPEDIAAAVVFLASPRSAFTNGVNLVVDGGIVTRVQF